MLDVTRCYKAELDCKQKKRTHGGPRTLSTPAVMVSNPSKKCKLWTEQQMISAIEAVRDSMNVYSAAREYVPRMILQDQISGRVVHGRNPGPQQYLNRKGTFKNFSKNGYGWIW